MNIIENYSLKKLNTFGIEVKAKYLVELFSVTEFQELLAADFFKKIPKMILGGGSNILFTQNYDGAVLKNNILGIELVSQDEDHYYVKAGAGENWHQFVLYCIEHNYAGVENLSLIPGNVGAGPMQNIGAYGVELKDIFFELDALNIETLQVEKFRINDCKFGYRESVFKNTAKDRYVIISVTFCLNKIPKFNTSYGAIEQEIEAMGVKEVSIKAVSDAVCHIRTKKLPDPQEIGNAGSFFKNPVIAKEKYKELKEKFSDIVGYETSGSEIKLAAGWLIEQCGWKGQRVGDAGVHKNQALVLVNYGKSNGKEIFDLSGKILVSVKEKFDVTLEREVNII
jgi:UDP-N-acetylmuramate dehydrogenase